MTNKELEQAVLIEKANGTPDLEIGKKYGVNLRYIEKVITKSTGINVGILNNHKKIKNLQPKDFYEEKPTV